MKSKSFIVSKNKKTSADKQAKIITTSTCLEEFLDHVQKDTESKDDSKRLFLKVQEIVSKICHQYHANLKFKDVGFLIKKRNIPKKTKRDIFSNLNRLVYGKVQSGKTNAAIGTAALARENNFRCIIVLTSDNVWLSSQTYKNISRGLQRDNPEIFSFENKNGITKKNIEKSIREINRHGTYEDPGVIFVVPKNGNHLGRLCKLLNETKSFKYPTLIIDDEADQASLDRNRKKRSEGKNVPGSPVFSHIEKIRKACPHHIYLQLTATPQALLLQSDSDSRPAKTILLEPGKSYVGGETFFSKPNKYVKTMVSYDEIDALKEGTKNIPESLEYALITFFAGCVKKLNEKIKNKELSFLVHICHRKVSHEYIRDCIDEFRKRLKKQIVRNKKQALLKIKRALEELGCKAKPIDVKKTAGEIKERLNSLNLYSINSDWKSPEPDYRKINIFVGGNRLSRGVTIRGLMGMYYGRDARSKKMDTVHQHARYFGYRKELINFTRIYMPEPIFKSYCNLFKADEATRAGILDNPENPPVFVGEGMQPTRGSVLNTSNIEVFQPGRAYYPHLPKYSGPVIRKNTKEINKILKNYISNTNKYYEVDIRLIEKLVSLMPCKHTTGAYSQERILKVLEALKKQKGEPFKTLLLVKTDRQRDRKQSIESGFADDEWLKPKLKYENYLLFIAIRQKGSKEKNWAGQEFYVPTIKLPGKGLITWYAKNELKKSF